ncbi:MAG: RHS repeat-associated core domain-containing protein, partial [Bacteroidota bacterium]
EPDGAGGYDYIYQYKDHLGNIRLSYSDKDKDGHIADVPLFEDGFESASGWESLGFPYGSAVTAYDNTFAHSGNYSAQLSIPEGGNKYVHSNTWVFIDNDEPTAYTYSGWAYSDGPGIRLLLFMNEAEETEYYTELSVIFDDESKNEWIYVEKTVLVPANIDKLNLRIGSFWGSAGSVWFDDIKLEKTGSEIVEEKNYYPFGLQHKGYNSVVTGTHYPYGFGGKEENEELELNWHDFGARNYQADLGRWMNVDPLADAQYAYSPYHYAYNSPIMYNDPTGMIGESITTNVINEDTGETYWINDGFNFDFYVSADDFATIQEEGVIPKELRSKHLRAFLKEVGKEMKKQKEDNWLSNLLHFFFYDDIGDGIINSAEGKYGAAALAIFLGKLKKGKKGYNLVKKLLKHGKGKRLPTPDLDPSQFKPGNKTGEWIHKKTGTIFSKSRTSHGNKDNVGDQWKAWPKGTTDFGNASKKAGTRITIDGDGNVIGN